MKNKFYPRKLTTANQCLLHAMLVNQFRLIDELSQQEREHFTTYYNMEGKHASHKVYNDCGTMIYDTEKQPVLAGGSGPVCSALVNFGYVYKLLLSKKVKRVLIVPTGALFSPTFFFQKESIPAIAHAISLEVTEK